MVMHFVKELGSKSIEKHLMVQLVTKGQGIPNRIPRKSIGVLSIKQATAREQFAVLAIQPFNPKG